jgi:nitronate monooxygenase
MGVGVSCWRLAHSVSQQGQLGVVSGTALAVLLARTLQQGDPGGHMRRALAAFPIPAVVERILDRFFIPGGKPKDAPFRYTSLPSLTPSTAEVELTVAGNFVEVWLAKEGHSGPVGINFLEKIQFPTLPSLFGAMLAGVDYVLMGAGIPRTIPGVMDGLAKGDTVKLRIDVLEAPPTEEHHLELNPRAFWPDFTPLRRPAFLAIVASATLAIALAKKSTGRVDGFIIEGPTAGGHNAPPRGALVLNTIGEPVNGPRDVVDLDKIRELGLPFWLAGSYGTPERLKEALATGAAGVQVGTAFAFCNESGIDPALKQRVIDQALTGNLSVRTDPVASPTGFPFKVVQLPATLSSTGTYEQRSRICDLGYLRMAYRKTDGSLGYRCPAEPVQDYLRKGGKLEDTVGRKCVCNGLLSTMGLGQVLGTDAAEPPLLTAGDDLTFLNRYVKPGTNTYAAADVLNYLLGSPTPA